ncbi:hypothetical protein RND71_029506 [Anisodus tanguticus]|uniref:Uncharacterized protein n=1 Tax=Anisodus tanguticus TaxID=243964 RepID=A0AAE1RFL0_9SOLA|nr:hypothetical protein RND71_029506 [Anisodus tanguticus]
MGENHELSSSNYSRDKILEDGILQYDASLCPLLWIDNSQPVIYCNILFRFQELKVTLCSSKILCTRPDISMLRFPTYFSPENKDQADLEPLVADLGDTDPFMAAD